QQGRSLDGARARRGRPVASRRPRGDAARARGRRAPHPRRTPRVRQGRAGAMNLLELRGLGKDYGERTAVKALDLDVVQGEILGLLGPNGAGKTTTISMVCGVVTPTRGTVTIGGVSLAKQPRAAKQKLGLVTQDLALYEELAADQNLKYFGALYGLRGAELAQRVAWALEVVGLGE